MPKDINELYKETLCPLCDRHYRKLVKLHNDIALYCDTCLSFWTNPNKIKYEDSYGATYNHLINMENTNHDEIMNSPWNKLYEDNPFYLQKNKS
ncbi:Zn-finger protein [Acanthamoeba polyphaga moumouvirus]|uniref:Zn-finger protein n=1 Tax=Acanthamoeba polyphaga moumouvirus TaxID=1269028 RepID=L7RDD1_9VIRU|nr:Zn-finger protein [Acanthamoeba polyphaga moumouvirus]AGC02367.1 Zn-finger protein [Acanthamoeba polyphaga moumouvirus]AQN68722.1 Zn-finger protein [Saudi moumouvirus]